MKSETKEAYIVSQKAKIFYQCYGEGFPIILLHGNHQNRNSFRKQIEYFSDRFQVIAVDSRGHGQSELQTKKLTLNLMAEDVHTLLDQLGIEHCYLIGFSDGGNVALQLGLTAQEHLMGIVCIGSNLSLEGLKWWFRWSVRTAHFLLGLFQKIGRLDLTTQKIALVAKTQSLNPEVLQNIEIPVLVVTGEHDIVKRDHSMCIVKNLSRGELFVVSGGGHNVLVKKHENLNANIMNFFNQVKQKRGSIT